MASSIDQIVSDLGALFQKGADEAMRSAKSQPDRFSKLLNELAGTPEQILQKLKQQLIPPDWLSLMILIALQLEKLVGNSLEVGVWVPRDGWAKALLLTYTQHVGGVFGRLKLAISLGGAADAINGFVVVVENIVELSKGDKLELKASSNGNVTFFIPFGGSIEKDGAGTVAASIALDTPKFVPDELSAAGIDLVIGKPTIGGELAGDLGGDIKWKTFAMIGKIGSPDEPGLAAKADFSKLLAPLAAVIHIDTIEQSYKPALVVIKGGAPDFSLNQKIAP